MDEIEGSEDESVRLRAAAARELLEALAATEGNQRQALLQDAIQLAEQLRRHEAMTELATFVDHLRPYATETEDQALLATMSAQALVNEGQIFAARDVLLASPVPQLGSKAWLERQGLLGRTSKQVFVGARDRAADQALEALDTAISAYGMAFRHSEDSATWHGVNLAALASRAVALGRAVPPEPEPRTVATAVIRSLESVPALERDVWWHPTRAEAALALGDRRAFQRHLRRFINDPMTTPFALASSLRQLTDVWELDAMTAHREDRATIALLRAALLHRRGGSLTIAASAIRDDGTHDARPVEALEATFGSTAVKQVAWWDMGRERARAVSAVWTVNEVGAPTRVGTGFLIRVHDRVSRRDRVCVLTNAHVIGDTPPNFVAVAAPDQAIVRFEGGPQPDRAHRVVSIIWTSTQTLHDASLLEIEDPPTEISPIPLVRDLPARDSEAKLYVIGHALGQALAFSFADNVLLDHDGPPSDPPRDGVVRVHYRTPTQKGNSGSPTFLEQEWQAVALHHRGKENMPRLRGVSGTYAANEGVALASIGDALRSATGLELIFEE